MVGSQREHTHTHSPLLLLLSSNRLDEQKKEVVLEVTLSPPLPEKGVGMTHNQTHIHIQTTKPTLSFFFVFFFEQRGGQNRNNRAHLGRILLALQHPHQRPLDEIAQICRQLLHQKGRHLPALFSACFLLQRRYFIPPYIPITDKHIAHVDLAFYTGGNIHSVITLKGESTAIFR